MKNTKLSSLHFGLEIEAVSGPVSCPLGTRGTDHGGAVYEYRLGPITLRDWLENRAALREFFGSIAIDPCGDPPTGLHVHVEVPPEARGKQFFARLARLWAAAEKDILAASPVVPAREEYARPWSIEHCENIVNAVRGENFRGLDRYRTLNLASFPEHGTAEFRLWNGTADFAVAEEIVAFCLAVVWVAAAGCGAKPHMCLPSVKSGWF